MVNFSFDANGQSHRAVFSSEATSTGQPNLLPFIADYHLAYLLPIVTYWVLGLTFHAFDTYGWFLKYKTHTPAEFLRRNHATLYNVLKYAIIQQFAQCIFGYLLSSGPELAHKQVDKMALLDRTLHNAQLSEPRLISPNATSPWELALTWALYWVVIPAAQLFVALFLADTWQYFTHRLLHSNRWLYSMHQRFLTFSTHL